MNPIWTVVPDNRIRHVWRNPETDELVYIGPEFYQENGTPIDGESDVDLEYVRTEILV